MATATKQKQRIYRWPKQEVKSLYKRVNDTVKAGGSKQAAFREIAEEMQAAGKAVTMQKVSARYYLHDAEQRLAGKGSGLVDQSKTPASVKLAASGAATHTQERPKKVTRKRSTSKPRQTRAVSTDAVLSVDPLESLRKYVSELTAERDAAVTKLGKAEARAERAEKKLSKIKALV